MISSAELLTNFEHCRRWGYWSKDWHRHRMTPTEMLSFAVRQALTEDVSDPGESAGEIMVTLAAARGLEVDPKVNLYRSALNHAAIANLIVTAIRQHGGVWMNGWTRLAPKPPLDWTPSTQMDPSGGMLRRFIAVSYWSEERAFFEKHSWYVAGEIAYYEMPMQLCVAVLGPMSAGRRHNPWAKALLHPSGSELRFRLRSRKKVEGFRETWRPVYREEHDEIKREKWLASMMLDEVLEELLFVVNVPVPEESRLVQIRDLAKRQLDTLYRIAELPERQLSTCHNPIAPCPFRACCWGEPESAPDYGPFDRH